MSTAFPIIAGSACIPTPHSENLYFGNLKDLTDGSISKAKPDFYDGSRPIDLHKDIREDLGPYIVPSTDTAAACLPNFFTEGKAQMEMRPYASDKLYMTVLWVPGECTSCGHISIWRRYSTTIPIRAHQHIIIVAFSLYTQPILLRPKVLHIPIEYRMTQLRSFAMTDAPDAFRPGAGALRNARDWAREKREELINAANDKALRS